MPVRVSAIDFLIVASYVVIFGFLWRSLAAKWSDNSIGQAMAYIF